MYTYSTGDRFHSSNIHYISSAMQRFRLCNDKICQLNTVIVTGREADYGFRFQLRYVRGRVRVTVDHGGGGSSIVKVPWDVPPARVCFFKPSSLAKGILFANFSPFSLAKGILFANFRPFSLGKGILVGNFGQRNVKLR